MIMHASVKACRNQEESEHIGMSSAETMKGGTENMSPGGDVAFLNGIILVRRRACEECSVIHARRGKGPYLVEPDRGNGDNGHVKSFAVGHVL
jgi:hypothetical protein